MNTGTSKKNVAPSPRRRLANLFGAALVSPAILLAVYGAQVHAGQIDISAFQPYSAANPANIQPGPLALYSVSLNSIRPTQMNEGLTEVGKKTAGFDLLSASQLQANLLTDIEPVVIGPGGQLYLTDGHHTFTALSNSIYGASNPTVFVDVIANYSNLTMTQFIAQMQAHNYLLPLNMGVPQAVNPTTGSPIPTSLTALTSDPYRGLEYAILKNKSSALFPTTANITGAIGSTTSGLDKMTGFYSDFLEAAAYRNARNGLGLAYLSPGDIALATAWNLNGSNTTTLPNISGTVTVAQLPGFILSQNIVNAGGISNTTLAGGALDGNGTFTGVTTINAGTPSAPITIGTPNFGLVMQLGADRGNTVTLNGTNTYTGGTSILAGNLIVQSDASLGAAVPSGATIDPANVKTSTQAANGVVFNSLSEGAGTLTFGTTTGGAFTTNRPIAVGGEAATLNVNGNTVTLGGQINSLGVSGVGLGNATGFSDLTVDDLSAPGNGVLVLSQASPNFHGNLIIGNSGAPTVNVTSDAALGATTGPAAAIGQIDLNSGTLQAGASFAAPERNIFLGSGSQIDVNGFTTSWGTLTDVQRTLDILNSSTTAAGAATFNNLTIGSTSILQLAGGSKGETVTLTNGIVRTGADTLILSPTSGGSLGTTEQLFSGTGAASLVNGIGPAWIVTNNGVAKGAGPYDFVTYGSNGYVKATYNATTLTNSTGSNVIALAANTTAAGNVSAFALNTEGRTIALGGNTLTIGDGTNPAGLILASGSAISNGTVAFGGSNGVIWLSGSNPTISASLTGSNGLTFSGSGSVALSTAANVSGAITIDSGTVTLSGANIFAGDLSGVTLSNDKSKPAPATLAITADNTLTTLNATGNNAAINISNGAALTLGDTTNNFGSVDSATIKETGAARAGAVTLNGSGLFDFTGGSKSLFNLVSGSTIVVNNSAQLRAAANEFVAGTGIVLNGTSQLQLAENGGQVLGNAVSGTGALHLIGGTLLLTGTANTYSGGTIVETGSILDITTANLPAINANITNAGGLVVFDQATTGTYSGVISDGREMGTGPTMAGSLDKDDSTGANGGVVTIAQAQTFTGATTVEAGTLTLGATDTLATSSGVDLGRVGGGSTATLALGANNTIKGLTSEAGDTTTVTLGANTLTFNSPSGGAATYGGAITGSGMVVKNGSGAQAFTGAVSPGGFSVNAGLLDFGNGGTLTTSTVAVNGGVLEFDRGSALSATTVNVGQNGIFAAVGGSTTASAANFNNSGVLDVRNGAANNVFTVGAYTGLSGGQLVIGVTDASPSADRLVVASAAGSTQIVLSDPTPNTPAPFNPNGLPLVVSTAPLDPHAFNLAGAPIQKGLFQYDLAHNANQALLISAPNADAFRLAELPTAVQTLWNNSADVIMDHQGSQHALMDEPGADKADVWARAFGGWGHRDETQKYAVLSNNYAFQTGYTQDSKGLFAGFDSPRQSAGAGDATAQFGVAAGIVTSTLDFRDSKTRADFQGFSVALTGNYTNHNLFIDGAAKVDMFNIGYVAPALTAFGPAPQDFGARSYGALANAGYRIGMGSMGYVTPLAGLEFVSTHVDPMSLAGTQIAFGNSQTVRGRLGLDAGATLSENEGRRMEVTFNASYWSRLSGQSSAAINSGTAAPLLTLTDNQLNSYGEVGGALTSSAPAGGWSAFIQGEYQFASQYTGGSLKVGVRRAF